MTTDIHDRIAKLLRKAEGTTNQAEAEAFSRKAEELLIKHNLDRAVIETKEGRSAKIISAKMTFPGVKSITRKDYIDLCHRVGIGLGGLKMIMTPNAENWKLRDLTIVGHESDVEAAMSLMSSILIQAQTATAAHWREYRQPGHTTHDRGRIKAAFMSGYGSTVMARLTDIRLRATKAKGTGTDLVLVNRMEPVNDHFAELFPSVRTGRGRKIGREGYFDGADAGHRADLGQKRATDGRRTAIQN